MNDIELHVPDMTCDHCAQTISSQVRAVAGVTDVTVDLDSKRVRVIGDATPAAVCSAITGAGYQPRT